MAHFPLDNRQHIHYIITNDTSGGSSVSKRKHKQRKRGGRMNTSDYGVASHKVPDAYPVAPERTMADDAYDAGFRAGALELIDAIEGIWDEENEHETLADIALVLDDYRHGRA